MEQKSIKTKSPSATFMRSERLSAFSAIHDSRQTAIHVVAITYLLFESCAARPSFAGASFTAHGDSESTSEVLEHFPNFTRRVMFSLVSCSRCSVQ